MTKEPGTVADLARDRPTEGREYVHIVSQGKGGVGKSLVSTLVAQYLLSKPGAREPRCFDTDPVNRTFAGFLSLNVEELVIAHGNVIDERGFDRLIDSVCRHKGPSVVDTGATTFLNFWNYLVEGNVFQVLSANERPVFIHCVVTGGQAMRDTLLGLNGIARHAPPRSVVVWLNEYFGPVTTTDGLAFEELEVYERNEEKMRGLMRIPERGRNTFGADVRMMLENRQTFSDAIGTASLMTRSRLGLVRDDVFAQLRVLGM